MNYPQIDPIALSLGPLKIRWYGLTYLAAFILCWLLALHRCKQAHSPVKKEQIEDLIFYAALGVIVGGRLGYCIFYGWQTWLADPLWVFMIWTGGMSFHGGAIGVVFAAGLFARKIDKPLLHLLDWMAPFIPIGLFLGRMGNFIGQELWGRPTDVPWAMVFPRDPEALLRHPSQLYEALLEGVLLFVLLYLYTAKQRRTGMATGLFLIGYALCRSFVELFREPDAHIGFDVLGWVTRGQLLCLPMLVLGLWLVVRAYRLVPTK